MLDNLCKFDKLSITPLFNFKSNATPPFPSKFDFFPSPKSNILHRKLQIKKKKWAVLEKFCPPPIEEVGFPYSFW